DQESVDAALATGARRGSLGTGALEDPDWSARDVGEDGDRVALGLDVRMGEEGQRVAARGWGSDGGDEWQTVRGMSAEGAERYGGTDVSKDGTLQGPNLDLLRDVASCTDAGVIASGGVSTVQDLRSLATLEPAGVEGAIIGKALYN